MREMIAAMELLGHEVIPLIMGGLDAPKPNEAPESSSIHPTKNSTKARMKRFIPTRVWQSAKDIQLLRFDRHSRRELEALIGREKPDLIYERAFYLSTAGVRAAQRTGVLHVLEMNAPYPEERRAMEGKGWLDFLGRMNERTQLRLTQRVVVVSTALSDYVARRFEPAARKTVITPNAVRSDFEPPSEAAVEALRKSFNLDGKYIIGFIGSIFPYHGVDRLIDAFGRLRIGNDQLMLLIAGDGEILPQLQSYAHSLGIANRVIFTGRIPHAIAATYIALMDVCVMPHSNWYGSPVKVFEYGALGKTIVAPDLSPLRDVIVPDKHGILIHDGDLHAALRTCINDPDRAKRMALAFQTKVFAEHTWRHMAERVLELPIHK